MQTSFLGAAEPLGLPVLLFQSPTMPYPTRITLQELERLAYAANDQATLRILRTDFHRLKELERRAYIADDQATLRILAMRRVHTSFRTL